MLISPVDDKDRRDISLLREERMILIKVLRISSILTCVAKIV